VVIGGNKLPQGCTVVPIEKGGLCLGAKRRGCAKIIMVVPFLKKNKGLCFFSENRVVPFFEKKLPPLGHVWFVST
jgi:hypothetical protein